ncbi:MAG: hypothetical protein OIN86_11685 [Candidatus Methanoperedens sp.]|nr:hypothetical protein [Candidatus Methanoperedens sp.]CAG0991044.1 hypothetical protein METP1_02298 [Methanosarcinales archaeon]
MTETEIDEEMKSMLAEGEKILIIAEQSRTLPGGSLFTPNTILVTNDKCIYCPVTMLLSPDSTSYHNPLIHH